MCVCRLRDRRMPTSARVSANSKDWEHSCRLFLDVQTQMERTPPLLFWCGGAASLVGFFVVRGRGQLWDRKQKTDFPGGKPCSPVMDLQRKNTMSAAEKKPTLLR